MNASQPLFEAGPNRWAARLRSIGTTRWSFLARPTVLGIVLIAIAFLVHVPSLDQPLLATQNFRQTHTAYNALIFHEQGIDLYRPQVPGSSSTAPLTLEPVNSRSWAAEPGRTVVPASRS